MWATVSCRDYSRRGRRLLCLNGLRKFEDSSLQVQARSHFQLFAQRRDAVDFRPSEEAVQHGAPSDREGPFRNVRVLFANLSLETRERSRGSSEDAEVQIERQIRVGRAARVARRR